MNFFHELSWVQIILFELGGLFQFLAVCVFTRERWQEWHEAASLDEVPAEPRRSPSQRAEPTTAQQVASYQLRPKRMAPALVLQGEEYLHEHQDAGASQITAANLLKTSKVKFKQTFVR